MQSQRPIEGVIISEMAIVDTFTKLIFGESGDYSPRERLIIDAFREVDANVFRDTYPEMGEYLRNLGVREMIHLVARLKEHISEPAFTPGVSGISDFGTKRVEH